MAVIRTCKLGTIFEPLEWVLKLYADIFENLCNINKAIWKIMMNIYKLVMQDVIITYIYPRMPCCRHSPLSPSRVPFYSTMSAL